MRAARPEGIEQQRLEIVKFEGLCITGAPRSAHVLTA